MPDHTTPERTARTDDGILRAQYLDKTTATKGIRAMLLEAGAPEDKVFASGVIETPNRVVKAYTELLSGYQRDPEAILSKRFETDSDSMVVLSGINFTSICEHHLMPFTGKATVAYIPASPEPGGKYTVVGLSKLARLVDCFAQRLQMQETMGNEIREALTTSLRIEDAAVLISATHGCMACRGVKKSGAMMHTASLSGRFRDDPAVRAELYALHNH